MTITKKQLTQLFQYVESYTDFTTIHLKAISVEGKVGILGTIEHSDQRESWTEKFLIIGDGVVKVKP